MIDHEEEDLIPFETCGEFIPGNPCRATTYRWTFKGVNGVKLDSIVVGNKRFTSRQAIKRLILALNANEQPAPSISKSQRQRQAGAANEQLITEGR